MASVETYRLAPPEPIRFTYMIDGVLSAAGVWLDITRNSVTGGVDEVDVYDWEDATFKALAAVISPIVAMSPVPGRTGRSRVDWNIASIVNAVAGGDVYAVTFYSDVDGTLPIGGAEIRVRNVDAIFTNEADIAVDLGGQIGNVTIDVNAHTDGAVAPLATSLDVAASTAAIEAYGQAHWVTADISTLATAASLAAVAADATKARRALWNRRTLSSAGLFTLYADDAATPLATASITDKDGGAITLQTGEAARSTALV